MVGVLWGYFAKIGIFQRFDNFGGQSANIGSLRGHPEK
jgi:hypothetical protein